MKLTDLAKAIDYDNFDDVMIEKKLFKQANVLDVMFLTVADRAMETGSPEMILAASKLQESCRKTLMALHEIRNPKKPTTTFVKQLVQEQTNNQLIVNPEIKSMQLGESNAPPVDYRAEIETKGTDSELEALDKIDRCKKSKRQGTKQQKRCET